MVLSVDLPNKFAEYIQIKEHYYHNLQEVLSKGEYGKASEYLWGVVAQSIKALALLYKTQLGTHPSIKRFVRQVSTEIEDSEYYSLFLLIEKLHVNFYDEIIEPGEFQIYLNHAKKFLDKTQNLTDKKLGKT